MTFSGSMAAMSKDRGPALLVMFGVVLVWSGAFAALKFGLSTLSPGAAVLLRFLPVWLVCGVYLVHRRREFAKLLKGHPWKIAGAGLLGVAGYHLFLTFGLAGVTSAASSLIVACGSLFTYLFSVLARTERPRLVRFAGIAVALGGLFVVLRYGSGAGFKLEYLWYALVVFGAPLAWSGYTVVSKKIMNAGCDIRLLTAATFFLGGLPAFFFIDRTFFEAFASPGTLLLIGGYLGLVASLAGYFAWNWALSRSDPSQVAAFIVLIPVLAHLWGYVFLGELLTWLAAVGGVLVLAGVLIVNVAGRNKLSEPGLTGRSP
ncbi:MAG TPA: DMT family transporter [bacterium]|nr:DMT family transporter [bacterium]